LAMAVAGFLFCSVAGAQTRGGSAPARMPASRPTPAAFTTPRPVRQATVVRVSANGQVTSGFANGVPGLGFDYSHLAAIRGGFRHGPSGNLGRGGHHRQSSFVPLFIGGYPYYYGGVYGDTNGDSYADSSDYAEPQQQVQQQYQAPPPQVIVIQQPVPAAASQQDMGNDSGSQMPVAPLPAAPAAVAHDVGEFILVRKDGRILFASAFSVGGDQLHYVTPEGIRRSLPMAEVDADATQQMNEARGTALQLRN
jgi:hypothetical protein